MKLLVALLLLCWASNQVLAEQKVTVDGADIHYIVLSTMDLAPDIAARYGIERSARSGFMNVSAISTTSATGAQPEAVPIRVTAEVRNLLGQVETVHLREIRETPARYAIGTFSFSPEETMRFTFIVEFGDGRKHVIEHEQKMFVEEGK